MDSAKGWLLLLIGPTGHGSSTLSLQKWGSRPKGEWRKACAQAWAALPAFPGHGERCERKSWRGTGTALSGSKISPSGGNLSCWTSAVSEGHIVKLAWPEDAPRLGTLTAQPSDVPEEPPNRRVRSHPGTGLLFTLHLLTFAHSFRGLSMADGWGQAHGWVPECLQAMEAG